MVVILSLLYLSPSETEIKALISSLENIVLPVKLTLPMVQSSPSSIVYTILTYLVDSVDSSSSGTTSAFVITASG